MYQQRQFNIDERKFTYILRPGITLIGITGVLFIIQILYYLITYSRPLRAATAKSTERVTADKDAQPVSVIVYAHGEPEDLRNNLPILLNQDYPDYEIIVVNDGSDANSEDVLKLFQMNTKTSITHMCL